MIVSELIETLNKYDPNAEVYFDTEGNDVIIYVEDTELNWGAYDC